MVQDSRILAVLAAAAAASISPQAPAVREYFGCDHSDPSFLMSWSFQSWVVRAIPSFETCNLALDSMLIHQSSNPQRKANCFEYKLFSIGGSVQNRHIVSKADISCHTQCSSLAGKLYLSDFAGRSSCGRGSSCGGCAWGHESGVTRFPITPSPESLAVQMVIGAVQMMIDLSVGLIPSASRSVSSESGSKWMQSFFFGENIQNIARNDDKC